MSRRHCRRAQSPFAKSNQTPKIVSGYGNNNSPPPSFHYLAYEPKSQRRKFRAQIINQRDAPALIWDFLLLLPNCNQQEKKTHTQIKCPCSMLITILLH